VKTLTGQIKHPLHCSPYKTHITHSKEDSINEQLRLINNIQIFSNGSGHNGRIGAAAVLMRAGQAPHTL
ncbi:hypothetical protein CY34DRAFT_99783, partial [Suillus luteus UH-Slu-Lm8-n1]